MDYEEKLELLHQIVDAADIEDAQGDYAARHGMTINGAVACEAIRGLFGWDVSVAARHMRALKAKQTAEV